ncbi:hypothetical protein FHR99_003140 [Litorivivens lipolytica]|uniref:Uncharacterized protein n=1 Tax=Litorivivens lipolytica TaxID=1524264 RepID=A0A7W4W7C8_9GAMM|nr:hypothetical protein [Litorivivens lipolytica]MBB3048866.1 hypothetical protein [Litorivivens lipolytica]
MRLTAIFAILLATLFQSSDLFAVEIVDEQVSPVTLNNIEYDEPITVWPVSKHLVIRPQKSCIETKSFGVFTQRKCVFLMHLTHHYTDGDAHTQSKFSPKMRAGKGMVEAIRGGNRYTDYSRGAQQVMALASLNAHKHGPNDEQIIFATLAESNKPIVRVSGMYYDLDVNVELLGFHELATKWLEESQ